MVEIDFAGVSQHVQDVLHRAFDNATVVTDPGWHGRVHVKIISPVFDGRSETEKQEMVWSVLRTEMGAESQNVSLVLVYGTEEY